MGRPPRFSSTVLMLSLLLLAILWTSDACEHTAWKSGRMDAAERLQALTISSGQANSCTCCALCYQRQTCASLSFNSVTSECELYSSVASYATLQPDSDNEWSYYVMPGRSETGQFCRQDSDCVTSGDFCRGRFCTSLDKVTCRTITDNFGSIQHYAFEPKVYGWVGGKHVKLHCWMRDNGDGYTPIIWSRSGHSFNRSTTLFEYNLQLESSKPGQSLLYAVEDIRQLETSATYEIYIWALQNGNWETLLVYQAPRDEPVLSDTARTNAWQSQESGSALNWNPSMLWMPSSGSTLLTTNADDGQITSGAMATSDGVIDVEELWVYILE